MIMGQNCERYLKMCLESVKDADKIIYCDGGSTDGSIQLARSYAKIILENEFKQEDKLMNSKQKNFWFDYLKKNHIGEWVLYLDADEVVNDFSRLSKFMDNQPEDIKPLISIQMRHFEGTLGFEDATEKEHYVPNRLFKVSEDMYFPDGEHTVLWMKKNGKKLLDKELTEYCGKLGGLVIWHLAYCSGIWDFRKRYLNHLKKSEIHTMEFMDEWYMAHLFGAYSTKAVNADEIPPVILKEFLIEPDKIYFMNRRTLQTKHFIMSKQWLDYFKAKTVLDLGCGLGLYGVALSSYGADYTGLDVSKWAIENTTFENLNIKQGDIREKQDFKDFDLVMVVDVLEHLEEEELDNVLETIKRYGKRFLFSFPVIGMLDLSKDPTHRIHKEQEWWINKLTNHFKLEKTPDNFMYKNQIYIGMPK